MTSLTVWLPERPVRYTGLMRLRWRRAVVVFIALAAMAIIIAWRLTRVAPAWYAPPPANDPKIIELADRAEYRLVQEAQKLREPNQNVWTVRIRQEQVNAWLAARLVEWLEHEGQRWPANLGTPQVRIAPEAISIALPLISQSRTRFIVASINPVMERGHLRLDLKRVLLGRISLPGEPLANLVQMLADAAPGALDVPQLTAALDWLRRRESIDPVVELADDRRVRILDIQSNDGWIDITARTLSDSDD